MNGLSTIFKPTLRKMVIQQTRCLSSSPCVFFKKNPGFDKYKIDGADSLMENAPDWKESNATESEADIKAEREPEISPEVLKEETAEWVRSHKDDEGNLPPL